MLTAFVLTAIALTAAPRAALADDGDRVEGNFSVLYTYPSAVVFTLTAANGDALSGTYAGYQGANDESGFGPFQGTLTVTAGTGGSRRVRGRLQFTAGGGPNSASETASAFNGTTFYLVQGKLSFPGNR